SKRKIVFSSSSICSFVKRGIYDLHAAYMHVAYIDEILSRANKKCKNAKYLRFKNKILISCDLISLLLYILGLALFERRFCLLHCHGKYFEQLGDLSDCPLFLIARVDAFSIVCLLQTEFSQK
ncbi:MAG: hypothetical protein AB7J19_13920, partial [Beijerinckiaceae bacterium]